MRRVYLIRHGQTALPGGERRCVGTADDPLSALGRLQACLVGEALRGHVTAVFASPLSRALETARFLAQAPRVIPGLREMDQGEWDGLPFSEIRRRWPALYAERERDKRLPPPGAEPWAEGQRRFAEAVAGALRESEGDIAIVAHAAVNEALLCRVLGREQSPDFSLRQRCGSWYLLREEGGVLTAELPWRRPQPALSDALCLSLLRAAQVPEPVFAHCLAVADEAERITAALHEAGHPLDGERIRHAALLHDIARVEPQHPRTGAAWLETLGYPDAASLIRQHHDPEGTALDEAAVVFLADKCVQGERRVPLKERFAASQKKCAGPEALAAHERRARQAESLAAQVNAICKREVIPI